MAQDRHALVESDEADDIGCRNVVERSAMDDGERVQRAAAARFHHLDGLRSALDAERSRVVLVAPAFRAALDHELLFRRAFPDSGGVGVGFGQWPHESHQWLPRMTVECELKMPPVP